MEQGSRWKRVWRWARWIVLAFVLFYLFGAARLAWFAWKTPEAVARIHARAVTMDMVMGKDLPPEPLAAERDKTVAGVDANKNGVRDDVELAIWRAHPESAKIRAAQLQYAMALQSQLTEVFSEGTLVAAIQETGRGFSCIYDTHKEDDSLLPKDKPSYEWTRAEMDLGNKLSQQHDAVIKPLIKEVETLLRNNDARKYAYDHSYDYMTSYGGSDKPNDCDLELNSLPN